MTLSTGPWWWAPVFAFGWMTTVPAHSFSAPARACVIAAARFIPGVCAGLMSSSFECTTRTPWYFHLVSLICSPLFLDAIQRLREVRNQVIRILDPDRDPYQCRRDREA